MRRPAMRLAPMLLALAMTALSGCGGSSDEGGDDEGPQAVALANSGTPAGRSWRAGQLLESAGTEVQAYRAGMADASGAVIAVFVQKIGTRHQLQAVRGTPGSAGTPPAWSAPAVISGTADPATDPGKGGWNLGLSVTPDGRAHATWLVRRACAAPPSTARPAATCSDLYGAAFDGSHWGAPARIADSSRPSGGVPGSDSGPQQVALAVDTLFGFPISALTRSRLFGSDLGHATLMVSSSGVGALVTSGTLASLPTADMPGGVNGAVYSLWGWFLK